MNSAASGSNLPEGVKVEGRCSRLTDNENLSVSRIVSPVVRSSDTKAGLEKLIFRLTCQPVLTLSSLEGLESHDTNPATVISC